MLSKVCLQKGVLYKPIGWQSSLLPPKIQQCIDLEKKIGELGANMYTRLSSCIKLVVMQASFSEDLTLWSTKYHKY